MDLDINTFKIFLKEFEIDGEVYKFYDVSKLNEEKYIRLPYSIRVLLESAVRNCDEIQVTSKDVKNILNWPDTHKGEVEVPFLPSRVLLQDFTGVPALVDFATLRDALSEFGENPNNVNPNCPVDLVIDHSVHVDIAKRLIISNPSPVNQANDNSNIKVCFNESTLANSNCCLFNKRSSSPPPTHNSFTSTSSSNLFKKQRLNELPKSRPSTPSNQLTQQQQLLKQNFRNQIPSLLANPNATATNSNNCLNENLLYYNNQVLIEAGYKECPFHLIRTQCAETLEKNQEQEFERNYERFQFLKWSTKAFENMSIVPPGSGVAHQVNLEFLARVVFNSNQILYPDSMVGTDTHTTVVNGMGVVGWTVGGIEAESVMLGQAANIQLPEVVGYRIKGKLNDMCTSTDIVIAITKNLRQIGVVNKFVEFFGSGVLELSMADRTTIANMCPEYGALIGYFPVDEKTIQYLLKTGRDEKAVKIISEYLKQVQMYKNYSCDEKSDPVVYSEVHEIDLSTIVPCVSGPKRPQDKIFLNDLKNEFQKSLTNKLGFNGFGLKEENENKKVNFIYENTEYTIEHGSVVLAAITSCTNTSNPSVMLAAALLAKKAVDLGLKVKPYIKTSISPGSGVVTEYLNKTGMLPCLESLGFNIVGYGCMDCIKNSSPLSDSVVEAIEKNDLIAVGVLSGNRNFEGRIHPSTRASYLASPPLVIAYAIAGRINIDFETEPLGFRPISNKPIYLKDIWPKRKELQEIETYWVLPQIYYKLLDKISVGSKQWENLEFPNTELYPWSLNSTYIKRSPFFDNLTKDNEQIKPIKNANVLLYLGDSITTDHISPAGSIARNSPAAKYLSDRGLVPRDFNSYGSRRGNDAVMSRGTFANLRLVNKIMGRDSQPGPKTIFFPTGRQMDIFDATELYKNEKIPIIVIAGKEYGSGSPRDWAVKGPWMLGIKAIIAESFEKSYRNSLIGMGIIPLQFMNGESGDKLKLSGKEKYTIKLYPDMNPKEIIDVETDSGIKFKVLSRIDSHIELNYYRNDGMLKYVIRKFL